MNPKARTLLLRAIWIYFLVLETVVIITQVFRLETSDSWGRSLLLTHHASDIFTMIFDYVIMGAFFLFLCSQPIFF